MKKQKPTPINARQVIADLDQKIEEEMANEKQITSETDDILWFLNNIVTAYELLDEEGLVDEYTTIKESNDFKPIPAETIESENVDWAHIGKEIINRLNKLF